MTETVDRIWRNGRLASMADGHRDTAYGAMESATIACRDGRIAWIGHDADAPAMTATETINLGSGLID